MKPCSPRLLAATLFVAGSSLAFADVSLPRIFGDHMVLQRSRDVPFWGQADPGEKVTVTAGGDTASATAGSDGKWMVRLKKLAPSKKPIEVTVAGKNRITFRDVLVGDVWICSGQSNMDYGVINVPWEDIAQANEPQIRIFRVPKLAAPKPASDIGPAPKDSMQGTWEICTPETLLKVDLTAVGYYFGMELHRITKQPVGLIESARGGTSAQAWTSIDGLKSAPELQKYVQGAEQFAVTFDQETKNYPAVLERYNATLAQWNEENRPALDAFEAASKQWEAAAKQAAADGKPAPVKPVAPKPPKAPVPPNQSKPEASLFNGMIAPLAPYAMKGAIWYQGENNATPEHAERYRILFPALIADWRKHWAQGDFPFLYVQLANYMARRPQPGDSNWAMLREAQLKTLALPKTGMAVTIDLGEADNIHPKDKWDVGARLALAGRHVAYGEELVYSGPIYKSMKVEGSKVRVEFAHTGGGLVVGVPPKHFHPGEPRVAATELKGFAIAGEDLKFVWAKAVIKGNTVTVSSDAVPAPVAVRYAWADNPEANLYNKAGLPASPFRTDSDKSKKTRP